MRLLVCLHDNPLNGQEFDPLLPLLKEASFQPVVHKRPLQGSKLEPLLQSISATAKVSGGGPFTILAYSWGAYLALAYLKRYPEYVTGICLLNPLLVSLETENPPPRGWFAKQFSRSFMLKRHCRSLAASYITKNFVPDTPSSDMLPQLESFLCQRQVWRGEVAYQELMRNEPLTLDFEGITTPVKVLFGQQDRVAPIETQLPCLKSLSKLQSLIIPRAGHALPWTHPATILEELQKM